jgi:energy-coupling factor transporter transmembrane protein EcfT
MPEPLMVAVVAMTILALVLLVAGVVALARRRFLGSVAGVLVGFLLLALATLAATVGVAAHGYRALTHEEVAAVVVVEPLGPQRFRATFRFPDGPERSFEVFGDAIYVDAFIVKWHPMANVLGLHTGYELDRVGGRYADVEAEQTRPRTIRRLAEPRPVQLLQLIQWLPFLQPIVDAQYGSATFVPVRGPMTLELRVSTSGLLFREVPPGSVPASR